MKNLTQLAKIVKQVQLKSKDLITVDNSGKSKIYEFYNKLISNSFETDTEAAAFFYNATSTHSSYKSLKRSLKTKLINTLFFVDTTKDSTLRSQAHLYCIKHLAIAKILITIDIRDLSVDFLHKALKKAEQFEFTSVVIECSFYLRSHYGVRAGDMDKFEYYNKLLKYHLKLQEAEYFAGEIYLKIVIPYVKSKTYEENFHKDVAEAYEELAPYLEEYASGDLQYLGYYIKSLVFFTKNDYLGTIEVCKEAVTFFQERRSERSIHLFLQQEALCYTQLKMYEEGKEILEKSVQTLIEGSYNWFNTFELYFILCLHSNKYQEAYDLYNRVTKHKRFKHLQQHYQEKWQIFEAYLHFLVFINEVFPVMNDTRFTKFRMAKFLNSVPNFSKDKRGLNIPILIVQILFMIIKKDYDQAVNRIEAIEKYCSRYLRRDNAFRSNCFIKMLLQIPISGFHRAGVERRVEKYVDLLQSQPLEITKQADEIEIIPYENLWQMIVSSLATKFYTIKK